MSSQPTTTEDLHVGEAPTGPERLGGRHVVSSGERAESDADPHDEARRASEAEEVAEAPDVFLTVNDLQGRYGIGRTRIYRLIKEPWFPKPVVTGALRWSLASIRLAEASRADGGEPVVEPPRSKRRRPVHEPG